MFEILLVTKEVVGEKLPCYRKDVLLEHPFPSLSENTEHVIEGVVWLEIAKRYKIRCSNVITRRYFRDRQDDTALMNLGKSPNYGAWGKQAYFAVILSFMPTYFFRAPSLFVVAAIQYARFSFHNFRRNNAKRLHWIAAILVSLAQPVGFIVWLGDNFRHATKR